MLLPKHFHKLNPKRPTPDAESEKATEKLNMNRIVKLTSNVGSVAYVSMLFLVVCFALSKRFGAFLESLNVNLE